MNNEIVTTYMDWLAENMPWLAIVVGAIIKFGQDHLRIKSLERAMEDMKGRMTNIEKIERQRAGALARIETKLDYLVEVVNDNKSDIKDIHKNKS